jgi:glycerol-3-phosphate dehydrogenase
MRISLHGAEGWDVGGLPRELTERYGSDATEVHALQRADPHLAEPIVEGLPYSKAEVVYAARAEMACTVDDVLSRRTRARLLARDDSADAADEVAALLATELNWDESEVARQVAAYRTLVEHERKSGGLPETALEALQQPPT